MSRIEGLRHVAGLAGIQTRHVDALGTTHEPGEEVLSPLIAAFGLPVDPAKAAAVLSQETGAAPLGLPPVRIVAAEAEAVELPLRLPGGTDRVEWRIALEDGGRHEGTAASDPLLWLPGGLPLGYHRLEVAAGGESAALDLIVAPRDCYLPAGLQAGARSWGLTVQLYGVRSARNWGMGDFTDLASLTRGTGAAGGAALGLNPLHALFAAEPRHVSPYSPSSRIHLDYLYIDPAAVPGFAEDPAIAALAPADAIARARDAALVDHGAVAALKRPVLEALYRRFRQRGDAGDRGVAFREFQRAGGAELEAFATFEALHEHHYREQNGVFSWRDWPAPMRDPRSPEVAAFAAEHRDRVEFFQFLQWEADRQIGIAAEAGRITGLSIGLYRDLAVGVDPHGADAWADQELVAPGASIGAPPDPLSRTGQNWGLAPVNPLALRRRGFAPFIAALRANMRHAGVLRIDHVMAMRRLYWIPSGHPATDGAYVDYPLGDLLRLVALESRRNQCAVIGEDLGTLPEGFREAMQAANVLSYRIFAFERRHDGSFVPPRDYPALAAASAATHDLASLKGFWLGQDIAWRRDLRLYPSVEAERGEEEQRRRDRHILLDTLTHEGLLAPEQFGEFLPENGEPVYGAALGDAIHAFLARSRARLMLVQLEDVAGEAEQANLPGTNDQHPNWRRRLSKPFEEVLAGSEFERLAALIGEMRRQSSESARQ